VAGGRGDSCGHIIDYPVGGVESPFGYSPLLYYNHWPISKFRDPSMKLLLRKDKALSFEDIEHKETYVPDLSGQFLGQSYLNSVANSSFPPESAIHLPIS
jgi:hypothetical protein